MSHQLNRMSSTPMLRLALSALLAFGLDQLSKLVMLRWLDLASVHAVEVWPPYLNFVMAWNTGINFGLFSGYDGHWLLVAFSIAVALGLAAWVRNKRGWMLPLAAGAVVGGALGNALDRAMYGAVVDFLNMSCCAINNPYSFNLADVFIACGAVFIAIGHDAKVNDGK